MSTVSVSQLAGREADVLTGCLQWLTLKRVWHWRQNQGAIPLKNGGFRKFVGMKGLPDILAVIPRTLHLDGEWQTFGVFTGIEVKRSGEKPRPEQQAFLDRLRMLGGIAIVAHSVTELEQQLSPWLPKERS